MVQVFVTAPVAYPVYKFVPNGFQSEGNIKHIHISYELSHCSVVELFL